MTGASASRKDGVEANLMERYKHSIYPGIAVTPAVLEVYGRPGSALAALVRATTSHLVTAERSEAMSSIWQSISVTLQTHNAKMIVECYHYI